MHTTRPVGAARFLASARRRGKRRPHPGRRNARGAGAHHHHGVPRLHVDRHLGRGAGHVHQGQTELLPQVLRQLGVDAGLEEDGLRPAEHLLGVQVDGGDLVELQRGEGQGDEGGDPVAHLDVRLAGQIRPDLLHPADEDAAGLGHGVLELAPLRHDLLDGLGDAPHVAAALPLDAPEGGGRGLEGDDVDENFIGIDDGGVVHLLRRLRQQPLGGDHPVAAIRVPSHSSVSFPW